MRYIISSPLRCASVIALALAPTFAGAKVPQVVTDIPPIHSLVSAVMGDLGTPELLLEPGASEHDFQLRPSQAQVLAGSDLVVMVGPELTPWLEAALALRPEGAATLSLLESEGTYLQAYSEAGGVEAGHDHDHEKAAEAEAHVHEGTDPHAWLDPANGTLWLLTIAKTLSEIDPDNAKTYIQNAVQASEDIAEADAKARILLDPVRQKPFATAHAAFGYYAHYYGLTIAGALADGDAATPGAKRVVGMRDLALEGKLLCAFPETGHDPAHLLRVLEASPARLGGEIDPLGSTLPQGPGHYPLLIEETAKTLAACLSEG